MPFELPEESQVAPIASPRRTLSLRKPHRPFHLECPRCGQDQVIERGGNFRDEDYYELHQEHQTLQVQLKQALALLKLWLGDVE